MNSILHGIIHALILIFQEGQQKEVNWIYVVLYLLKIIDEELKVLLNPTASSQVSDDVGSYMIPAL